MRRAYRMDYRTHARVKRRGISVEKKTFWYAVPATVGLFAIPTFDTYLRARSGAVAGRQGRDGARQRKKLGCVRVCAALGKQCGQTSRRDTRQEQKGVNTTNRCKDRTQRCPERLAVPTVPASVNQIRSGPQSHRRTDHVSRGQDGVSHLSGFFFFFFFSQTFD
jgi:hypothetical protein